MLTYEIPHFDDLTDVFKLLEHPHKTNVILRLQRKDITTIDTSEFVCKPVGSLNLTNTIKFHFKLGDNSL